MLLTLDSGRVLRLEDYPALTWHVATPECHVAEILAQLNGGLYADIPRGGVAVDLGANCGLWSAWASGRFDNIVALEPSARHFKALKAVIREAHLGNVLAYNGAVWTHNGTVAFDEDNSNATMDRVAFQAPASETRVVSWRLDSLLAYYGIDRAACVKMDIEGAEEDVLGSEGFSLAAPKIGYLWCECHNYKNWDSGKDVGDRIESLVRQHFPHVERRNQDLVIGRRA